MSKTSLGMLLMAIGAIDFVLLSLMAVLKRKPVLLLAAIVGGATLAAVGLGIYTGKIL